jgi:hypothetical protein
VQVRAQEMVRTIKALREDRRLLNLKTMST